MGEILKLDPDVRAIISSGYADDSSMHNYRDHGFAAAIAKPYTADSLLKVLEEVFATVRNSSASPPDAVPLPGVGH